MGSCVSVLVEFACRIEGLGGRLEVALLYIRPCEVVVGTHVDLVALVELVERLPLPVDAKGRIKVVHSSLEVAQCVVGLSPKQQDLWVVGPERQTVVQRTNGFLVPADGPCMQYHGWFGRRDS